MSMRKKLSLLYKNGIFPVMTLNRFIAYGFIGLLVILVFSAFLPFQVKGILIPFFVLIEILRRKFFRKKNLFKDRKAARITLAVLVLIHAFFISTDWHFRALASGIQRELAEVTVDFVSKDETVLKAAEDLNGQTLGVLSDRSSDIGSIIPRQLVKDHKLSVSFREYATYLDLISALALDQVDLIVLPSGYKQTFGSLSDLKSRIDGFHTVYTVQDKRPVSAASPDTDILNIALIGGDNPITSSSTAGFNYDVIVVLSLNFKTMESAILSIPRDAYIHLTCTQRKDKITHSGWYGADCLTESLGRFLGIPISNYMLVDFKGMIRLVDSMGGVWIDVEKAIDEQDENRSFENMIHIDAGYQRLDGRKALAYLRHRKTLSDGAIGRSDNHERFIVGMLKQATNPFFIFRLGSVMGALQKSVITNLSEADIKAYYAKAADALFAGKLKDFAPTKLELSGHGDMIYTPSLHMTLYYYILDNAAVKTARETFKEIQTDTKNP